MSRLFYAKYELCVNENAKIRVLTVSRAGFG